jgi:hypothetical protein
MVFRGIVHKQADTSSKSSNIQDRRKDRNSHVPDRMQLFGIQMSNTEVLNAESKDISTYTKKRLKTLLDTAKLTVAATIIIVLFAFQKVSAQSTPDARSIAQKIADAQTEQEFKILNPKKQKEKLSGWVNGLSDKIQEQFSARLIRGEFYEAEKDLEFYDTIATEIKESGFNELVRKLQYDLENQQKIQKDIRQNVIDKIQHNNIETGSLQEIDGRLYATFTSSYKGEGTARDSATMGLNNFMRKNNLKTDANQYAHKILPQYGAYTVTAYVIISN